MLVYLLFLPFIDGLIIGECNEPNEWKTWLNSHRPTTTGLFSPQTEFSAVTLARSAGEFELVPHYQKIFAGQPFVCSKPTGLEVKTVDNREPSTTGDTFRLTFAEGFLCLNQVIIPRKKPCNDYKIKFCCPRDN